MVVIGVDACAMQPTRSDSQAVGKLVDLSADFAKLSCDGVNAVGFFMANMLDAADCRWSFGKEGDGSERRHRVADRVHIHVDTMHRPTDHGDAVCVVTD